MGHELSETLRNTQVRFDVRDGKVRVTVGDKEYFYMSLHEAILETRKK